MSKYIHFTEEQKAQARRTDIVSLLKSQGETVKRSGSEYEWKDGSQKVTIRGNLWFHQYDRVGGDAIDFVRRFYNKSYPEAMEYLLGNCNGVLIISPPVVKEKKPFELPKPYILSGLRTLNDLLMNIENTLTEFDIEIFKNTVLEITFPTETDVCFKLIGDLMITETIPDRRRCNRK